MDMNMNMDNMVILTFRQRILAPWVALQVGLARILAEGVAGSKLAAGRNRVEEAVRRPGEEAASCTEVATFL